MELQLKCNICTKGEDDVLKMETASSKPQRVYGSPELQAGVKLTPLWTPDG